MFQERLGICGGLISNCLTGAITRFDEVPVTRAMAYAASGGKRLRGFLVMETARLYGVDDNRSVWAAAAVEAMHAYSLVHDDLPCMDDDALRRGQPTVHVKWDEATAVLAGDGLQSLAFDLLTQPGLESPPDIRLGLISTLAQAAGAAGMVLGQAQDIAAETAPNPLNITEITQLQANKTGALIQWSAKAGAILGQADTQAMDIYSRALGLAFQIADDILDVEGDPDIAGKNLGKDARAGKATFVSLLGLVGAKKRAQELVTQAITALEPFGQAGETLREAAEFVISRKM